MRKISRYLVSWKFRLSHLPYLNSILNSINEDFWKNHPKILKIFSDIMSRPWRKKYANRKCEVAFWLPHTESFFLTNKMKYQFILHVLSFNLYLDLFIPNKFVFPDFIVNFLFRLIMYPVYRSRLEIFYVYF